MTSYEKEMGEDFGEAFGGAETYRMSDLEGRGEGYPEGVSKIYRQPRSMGEVLGNVPIDEETDEDDLPEQVNSGGEEDLGSSDNNDGQDGSYSEEESAYQEDYSPEDDNDFEFDDDMEGDEFVD